MELETYLDGLSEQLAAAADAGGEDARALARRLIAALGPAVRLMLLDALTVAAAEITRELAPGSVELRLRAGEPEFVVTAPPAEPGREGGGDHRDSWDVGDTGAGEGGVSRINLRLPDRLKSRVEQEADRDGLSINAWLVRAVAAALERRGGFARRQERAPTGGESYTGWGR
jgi:hypothetical protein